MSTEQTTRQEWMAALALAPEARLQEAWNRLEAQPQYKVVRGPETGLVMVRGRTGNSGERFNLGEMTVTRCTVNVDEGIMGHAFIGGLSHEHARLAAVFDALLQLPERGEGLRRTLISPLQQERQAYLASRRDEVRPSRVDFFTLVRGEE
ncbi:MAG: phosphonate C-P lyase system protein PhnG [Desulfomicrobium sp.]|nr:phosphonate C-P lyase system protein PhnG [Pseudomonadota bacterium]MBV1710679.1 phosphonate C-P lyase system protein PhnG [Desulfomicrobium sp.]MBU4570287.1 phosphonate C-P lyase system protein PhnG [Pseudomonadota bacterium]MBU4593207.1 phosphonate C-P lyase system protein PhnG [Pseudomonadota bacterium]MBV1720309.1 phosphonate C-P lyase system protein PhnG [Desulfomicrobium sp.]